MTLASLTRSIALLSIFIVMPVLAYSADFKELWREKGGTVKEPAKSSNNVVQGTITNEAGQNEQSGSPISRQPEQGDRQTPAKTSSPTASPEDRSPDASSFKYTWDDYQRPSTQLVRVRVYTSGSSSVYVELPQELLNSRESLTLYYDIESNFTLSIDGLARKTFEGWSAYCSVNGAGFFGKHRLRVNDLPARQTSSISISTKDLKAGRNTFEFSMAANDPKIQYKTTGDQVPIVYGIHKMWFSEFSTPSQEPTIEKVKDTPGDTTSIKQGDSEIEKKLIELKGLLDKGLINQEDYDRKKAELLDQL